MISIHVGTSPMACLTCLVVASRPGEPGEQFEAGITPAKITFDEVHANSQRLYAPTRENMGSSSFFSSNFCFFGKGSTSSSSSPPSTMDPLVAAVNTMSSTSA